LKRHKFAILSFSQNSQANACVSSFEKSSWKNRLIAVFSIKSKVAFPKTEVLGKPLLPFFLLVFFLFSCRTVPPTPYEEDRYIPLEAGAVVYIFADVTAAKPILQLLPIPEMNNRQVRQMLERTHTAAAAIFPQESGRRFQLVSQGNYPSFRAGIALRCNRHWRRFNSDEGHRFWHTSTGMLSLVLNSRQAFVAAWTDDTPGDPITPAPGVRYPEGLGDFRKGAVISFWLENPGPRLNSIFDTMGIPLQLPAERIFASLFPAEAEQKYEALIRMRVPTAIQARGLLTLFSIARNFAAPPMERDAADYGLRSINELLAAVLFANPLTLNDRDLNIKTAALSEQEIALLFSLFSIH